MRTSRGRDVLLIGLGVALALFIARSGVHIERQVNAAGGKVKSPTGVAPDRYVYYPGTEELARDEIRVVCCGSGLPAARRGQAATCFLIECGNGDKFFFDLGSGAMANVAGLMIPYRLSTAT